MSNKAPRSAPVAPPHDKSSHPDDPRDDHWCFGLAHPYIQRLIFLAGAVDRGDIAALNVEGCRRDDGLD